MTNILLQVSNLKSVLESPSQRGAGDLVDPTRFNSWAGRGVASSILPSVKTKVASREGLGAKVATPEAKIAVLEQRKSFHLVGLGLSLGLGILLLKWRPH